MSVFNGVDYSIYMLWSSVPLCYSFGVCGGFLSRSWFRFVSLSHRPGSARRPTVALASGLSVVQAKPEVAFSLRAAGNTDNSRDFAVLRRLNAFFCDRIVFGSFGGRCFAIRAVLYTTI